MSKSGSKRMAILGVAGLVLLWGVIALNAPSSAYAADTKPTDIPPTNQPNKASEPKPTPENGGRNCAMSRIVGYVMPNGEQQFYYVNSHGRGIKVGSLSGDVMRRLLNSPVGSHVLPNSSKPDFGLTDPPEPDFGLSDPPEPDFGLSDPPDPDRVPMILINQGGFVFTVRFNGADAICSRADFK
jgi:hypothetical protein